MIISCNQSTETQESIEYMSLNIGDIREYFIESDNSYYLWEVIGKTLRADSLEIYIVDESFQVQPSGIYKSTSYYFIRDGYFWKTSKDTISNSELKLKNPFNEDKLAEIFPSVGNYFLITEGLPDSIKLYMKADIIDSLETHVQTFHKIAEYKQYNNNIETGLRTYYAPYFGHIGSVLRNGSNESKIILTYLKLNNSEFGVFVPLQ